MEERRTGRTTRLVDKYIQELFTTGTCEVKDHCETRNSNEDLMRMILNRLRAEHGLSKSNCLEKPLGTRFTLKLNPR